MKVTPLEIRQKTFEKQLRGYDKDEVSVFLLSLSQEWERMGDEVREFRIKLEASEKEVTKLREVETSLFKTLKTAEDTGANVVEQARQTAQLQLKEAQIMSDAAVHEARMKANALIEESENRARRILSDVEGKVKALGDIYHRLESQRDNLVMEIRHLAEDAMERLEKVKPSSQGTDFEQQLSDLNREVKKNVVLNEPVEQERLVEHKEETELPETSFVMEEVEAGSAGKHQKSFFDGIG